jgi:hypothetical protein
MDGSDDATDGVAVVVAEVSCILVLERSGFRCCWLVE